MWADILRGRLPTVDLPKGKARAHIAEDGTELDKEFLEKARHAKSAIPERIKKRRYYERMKNDPEFKAKLRAASERWAKENPERYLELQRRANRAYYHRQMADPETREKIREKQRKNAAKRRERIGGTEQWKAYKREKDRAYILRMKEERPEDYEALLTRQREWRRKKRAEQRQGK